MSDAVTVFRALGPRDAERPIGDRLALAVATAATADARIPTNDFTHADLVMIHTGNARADGLDVVLPAGTELVVRGRRSFPHHLASAVDIQVTVLFLTDPDLAEGAADAVFTREMLMLSMAMASGDSGRGGDAPRFAGPLS